MCSGVISDGGTGKSESPDILEVLVMKLDRAPSEMGAPKLEY